jgi:site-specific DNA-cytosine methylase
VVINLELFSCSGGFAMGCRRAGIEFDIAVDMDPDHCDSYERNLGHRPLQMDVRELLRLVVAGDLELDVDLLVADPPCTPWSRAGKRLGTEDERDMLGVTCDLIRALRPRRYLLGNVPGLDDGVNLPIVQRTIGALREVGYCTLDYARLDAADFGVPQHRIRPFWFGHRSGPCIVWPAPTHGDPLVVAAQHAQVGLAGIGAAPLIPWVTCRQALGHLEGDDLGRPVRMRKRNDNGKQKGSVADRPARVVGTSNLSDGNVLTYDQHHPPMFVDEPGNTVRAGSGGGATRAMSLRSRHDQPVHTSDADAPARTLTTQCRVAGHASTVTFNPRHAPATLDAPAPTVAAKQRGQSGQVLTLAATSRRKRGGSTQGPQSTRTMDPDRPATTVQAREDRKGTGSPVLDWPWTRPATTIQRDDRIAPPGHHGEWSIMSQPDAVILSERAAAILQGFPDTWVFSGKTKKVRWSQLGQAMPPGLAEAVARSVVAQDLAIRDEDILPMEAAR